MNTTDRRIRTSVASEAAQSTHLMQKFHRVDHAAITVPALSSVRKQCDTTPDFVHFVLRTAQLFVSVDRKPQAREVLDVLEKRLLKTSFAQREPPQFRELVETYSTARSAILLGTHLEHRALEWSVESVKLQTKQDKMVSQPFYFEYSTADSYRSYPYQFENAIDAAPDLSGVVCFGKRALHVVYGGNSQDDVARMRELVLQVADQTGVKFTTSRVCASETLSSPPPALSAQLKRAGKATLHLQRCVNPAGFLSLVRHCTTSMVHKAKKLPTKHRSILEISPAGRRSKGDVASCPLPLLL